MFSLHFHIIIIDSKHNVYCIYAILYKYNRLVVLFIAVRLRYRLSKHLKIDKMLKRKKRKKILYKMVIVTVLTKIYVQCYILHTL